MNKIMDMRKESEILRLLLVTQSSKAINFNSNLLKIILMVLYDSQSEKLTANEIRVAIIEKYSLEFTEEEILDAIGSDKSGGSITITSEELKVCERGQVFYRNLTKYSLNQKQREKYFEHEQSDDFGLVVDRFSKQYDMGNTTKDEMVSLIERFLYNTFNTNTSTLLSFFINNYQNVEEITAQYSEEEKNLINDFLNWDDRQKDELVFMVASYCVEYCMLTVKKDYSSYSYIFNGKTFYLDSNVIFRLAGINNTERQTVMASFVKRCQDAGIDLRYTNHTYNEIKETVKRKIINIQYFLNGYHMVSLRNIRKYYGSNADYDFLKLYNQWATDNPDRYNDYEAFASSIMQSIDKILAQFKKEDFIDKKATNQDFENLASNLQNYKIQQNAKVAVEAIDTDINNFLYVQSMRNRVENMTISNVAEYLISTDGNLCEWNKTILPGAIPVVVRPSVWHSLLLKFKGRALDDYRAFSLFLNLRYKTDSSELDSRKPEILSIVQRMDESVSIKDSILDVIYDGLTTEYQEETDVNAIIKSATESVITTEAEKKAKEIITEESSEAKRTTVEAIAKAQAEEIVEKNKRRLEVIDIFRIILGVVFAIVCFFTVIIMVKNPISPKSLSVGGLPIDTWILIAGLVIPLIGCFVVSPVKKKIEKSTSYDEIYEEIYSNLSRQVNKNDAD